MRILLPLGWHVCRNDISIVWIEENLCGKASTMDTLFNVVLSRTHVYIVYLREKGNEGDGYKEHVEWDEGRADT